MQPTDSIGIKSHKEATCQSGIFFVYLFKVLVDMIWDFVWRLCMAGLLGTVIGLDREYREKDAGFRTHFLVAMGSALMMIVSQWGFEEFLAVHDGLRLDPSRIAAQVVSGIGFIGAGTIIFHRQIVRGLTTAASLWATAGIGLAAGAGMYALAAVATVLALVALEGLSLVFPTLGMRRTLVVFSAPKRELISDMFELLQADKYSILTYEVTSEPGGIFRASLVIRARTPNDEARFLDILRGHPEITVERIG